MLQPFLYYPLPLCYHSNHYRGLPFLGSTNMAIFEVWLHCLLNSISVELYTEYFIYIYIIQTYQSRDAYKYTHYQQLWWYCVVGSNEKMAARARTQLTSHQVTQYSHFLCQLTNRNRKAALMRQITMTTQAAAKQAVALIFSTVSPDRLSECQKWHTVSYIH